jgi:hypothetical protein
VKSQSCSAVGQYLCGETIRFEDLENTEGDLISKEERDLGYVYACNKFKCQDGMEMPPGEDLPFVKTRSTSKKICCELGSIGSPCDVCKPAFKLETKEMSKEQKRDGCYYSTVMQECKEGDVLKFVTRGHKCGTFLNGGIGKNCRVCCPVSEMEMTSQHSSSF